MPTWYKLNKKGTDWPNWFQNSILHNTLIQVYTLYLPVQYASISSLVATVHNLVSQLGPPGRRYFRGLIILYVKKNIYTIISETISYGNIILFICMQLIDDEYTI